MYVSGAIYSTEKLAKKVLKINCSDRQRDRLKVTGYATAIANYDLNIQLKITM